MIAFSPGDAHATSQPAPDPPATFEYETPLYVAGSVTESAQRNAPHLLSCLAKAPLARIPRYGPEVSIVPISPASGTPVRYGRTNAHCSVVFNLPDSARIEVMAGASAQSLQPGESLVFDPSFGIAYLNAGDAAARLLVFDIWHPQLSTLECDGLTALIQAIVDFDTRLQELA
ncbi:MAG TPA: aspartyl/asparaginyl beta-hydroxylase domain-containing protein [Rhodanobacter sp.]|nr:aspartyl/asparaginyl beta-hydroxylase domain-containing protein [Rhodanobacter sp.]